LRGFFCGNNKKVQAKTPELLSGSISAVCGAQTMKDPPMETTGSRNMA